jgi:hypothetical protein
MVDTYGPCHDISVPDALWGVSDSDLVLSRALRATRGMHRAQSSGGVALPMTYHVKHLGVPIEGLQ